MPALEGGGAAASAPGDAARHPTSQDSSVPSALGRQHRQLALWGRDGDVLSGAGARALYSAGDPHMAQGDGEISGTAIEASLNVMLQFVLHKDFPLRTQLLVTPTHWMVHAYHEDLNKRCTRPPWSCSTS